VNPSEGGKPVAVISERDVIKALAMKMPLSTPVEAFMSTRLISIRPDEDVAKAADLMINHNIRHLVITNPDGSLLEIVSIRDILRELRSHVKQKSKQRRLRKRDNGQKTYVFY
jgi:Predicted transcriptional regulator, contains C-terminal CBS domains